MTRFSRLIRIPLAFALVFTSAVPAVAAGRPDDRQAAQREQVSALKQAAFERLRDLHAIDLNNDYPASTRVSVYIDVQDKDLDLRKLSVALDGQPGVRYEYSPLQFRVLRQGNAQRIIRSNLAPGRHRMTLQFSGVVPRIIRDDKPVSGTINLDFVKSGTQAKVLVIPLTSRAFGEVQTLDPKAAEVGRDRNDPRLYMARFLRLTGHKYEALIELLEMAGPSNTSPVLPLAYDIELAQSYVDFGMRATADNAMRTAFDTGVSLEALADVWLRIAELDYQRGNYPRSYELLKYLRPNLDPAQLVNWQDTMSRLLMAEGQFGQAMKVLETGDNALEVLTGVELAANQTPVMRFNYAVTLLKQGETDRGRTLLERIGRITDFDEDQRALRDKANLLLSYDFLQAKQGATAKHILERIRLDGPYSNEALLALGWAELAPEGTRQKRAPVGDEPAPGTYGTRKPEAGRISKPGQDPRLAVDPFSRIQFGPFEQADMAETDDKALKKALVAWTEVAAHNPQDPAVQEAMIAIPYALNSLGKSERALNVYNQAIQALEYTRSALDAYINAGSIDLDAIAAGDLGSLPDAPWMLQFLAGYTFQEHYQNYLELHRMRQDLQRLAAYGDQGPGLLPATAAPQNVPAGTQKLQHLIGSLQTAAAEQAQLAQQAAAMEIRKQRDLLDKYLIAARLGVAGFQQQYEAPAPAAESQTQ